MDETGLFYRLEPDRTLATKRLSGRKKSKERLSIALCSNADGSHKLPPLIIGKYANLSLDAHNNFQEWLREFDRQVALKHGDQRVLLLLDNCTSHKVENLALPHVEIQFLPPNTTSKIQPINAGIIMSFKKHYRHHHIRWLLEQVEAGQNIQDLKMDVLQAIRNSLIFRPEEDITYEIFEDDQIITELIDIFKNSYENTEDLDEIDDSDEIVTISTNIALKSLETVNMFLLQQENTEEYIKLIGKIEKFIRKKQVHMMQQTTIDQYFN
ncbi:unnamed protein product [Rhizophagus irregularis]|uniref:DDE-1 domain-containing protein n=1 Tax=Rhizophagus irregularis TaxID=588596 RepID=A0A915ZLW7_9GLOM|nr:unnamed protein product [Rhizophagus irregularis]